MILTQEYVLIMLHSEMAEIAPPGFHCPKKARIPQGGEDRQAETMSLNLHRK